MSQKILKSGKNEMRMKVVLFGITMPLKQTFQRNTEEHTKRTLSKIIHNATIQLISKKGHIKQKINVFVYMKSLLELVHHESYTGLTPLSLLFQWKFARNNNNFYIIQFMSLHPD